MLSYQAQQIFNIFCNYYQTATLNLTSFGICFNSEGALEEDLRRYLMRKPMTTKDLLQKFKSKKLNMTNEKITQVIAQLLKKINPDKTTINKKLYLSLKKDDIP